MYEDSIRIPLLVRYPPKIRSGTVVDQSTLNIDLAPSLFEIAGIRPPEAMQIQGRSWAGCLAGERLQLRDSWLYEYFYEPRFAPTPTMQGVRTQRWKYIRYPDIDDIDELYDLQNDPQEMRNLVGDPAAAATLLEMRAELYRLLRTTRAA
jgi:arylsulfatase A-like enzyme